MIQLQHMTTTYTESKAVQSRLSALFVELGLSPSIYNRLSTDIKRGIHNQACNDCDVRPHGQSIVI